MNLDPNQPLMTQLVQEDFLVTRTTFQRIPMSLTFWSNCIANKLSKCFIETLKQFTTIWNHFKEIESDQKIAEKVSRIHEDNECSQSFLDRLQLQNLIFWELRAISGRFLRRKVDRSRNSPNLTALLDNEPERKMIKLMTRFFDVYTIRKWIKFKV